MCGKSKKLAEAGLTTFEESYLAIIEDRLEPVEEQGFQYIPEETFLEDLEEDEEEFSSPENTVKPEDVPLIEEEYEIVPEKLRTVDYSQVIFKTKYGNRKVKITLGKLIGAIQKCNGIRSKIADVLGLRKSAMVYIFTNCIEARNELEKLKEDGQQKFRKRPTNKVITEALFQARGSISKASAILNYNSANLRALIKNSPELTNKLNEVNEMDMDYTESQRDKLVDGVLAKGIDFKGRPVVYERAPDIKAIDQKMKAKGKARGYGNSLDVNKTINATMTITGLRVT